MQRCGRIGIALSELLLLLTAAGTLRTAHVDLTMTVPSGRVSARARSIPCGDKAFSLWPA
jgi:hypothetical protein